MRICCESGSEKILKYLFDYIEKNNILVVDYGLALAAFYKGIRLKKI